MDDRLGLRNSGAMRRSAIVAGAMLLAAAGLLTACGNGADESSAGATTALGMPPEAVVTEGVAPGGPAVQSDKSASTIAQQVIRTASVSLRVEDVSDAGAGVVALVITSEGFVQQQDLANSPDAAYETITARVPADGLDAFLAGVSGLGTVESLSSQAADVTQQTVDLEARIGALTASVERLEQLLAATGNVADLVAVETELANRQAELDSLVSQRDYLADQVSYSTVTISLSPTVEPIGVTSPGFLAGLQNGWTTMVTLAGAAVTALGFLSPFILISCLIAVPIIAVIWATTRRRKRRAGRAIDQPPAPEGREPGTNGEITAE